MLRRCGGGGRVLAVLLAKKKYEFFEDHYPQQAPAKAYDSYEDQLLGATVKNLEPKKQLTESERLHALHTWKQDDKGWAAPSNYGWTNEWGPEPGEEGHNTFYNKPRQYMSTEETTRSDMGHGTPLKANQTRSQTMPLQERMMGAAANLAESDPQFFDTRTRDSYAKYSYEQQSEFLGTKDQYTKEWLAKPGVTRENVTMKISEYNGTNKKQKVKPVPRQPEWELAPPKDDD